MARKYFWKPLLLFRLFLYHKSSSDILGNQKQIGLLEITTLSEYIITAISFFLNESHCKMQEPKKESHSRQMYILDLVKHL